MMTKLTKQAKANKANKSLTERSPVELEELVVKSVNGAGPCQTPCHYFDEG